MKYSNHLFPSFTHTNLSAMVIFLINISVLPGFTISWSICVHTCSHVCEASHNADDKLGNIINILGFMFLLHRLTERFQNFRNS